MRIKVPAWHTMLYRGGELYKKLRCETGLHWSQLFSKYFCCILILVTCHHYALHHLGS
uniref:Uncharacterized protein n=1 Tax=Rhizophora mucronata TaxID=61149 RepID=A0A2P2QXX8_RHIMU